jgi:hypothetical protein
VTTAAPRSGRHLGGVTADAVTAGAVTGGAAGDAGAAVPAGTVPEGVGAPLREVRRRGDTSRAGPPRARGADVHAGACVEAGALEGLSAASRLHAAALGVARRAPRAGRTLHGHVGPCRADPGDRENRHYGDRHADRRERHADLPNRAGHGIHAHRADHEGRERLVDHGHLADPESRAAHEDSRGSHEGARRGHPARTRTKDLVVGKTCTDDHRSG